MMGRFRSFVAVAMSCLLLSGGASAVARADTKLVSGACSLDLEVTRSTTEIDITTPTPGLCLTSDGVADGEFTASDLTVIAGTTCALGAADGKGGFDLEFGPFDTMGWGNLEVTVAYAEPDVELVFEKTDENSSIVAVGTFVQSPTSDSACDGTSATLDWSGTITFEDPVFE